MLQLDAAALAARLDRRALIDALDEAFPREQHSQLDDYVRVMFPMH